MNVLTASRDTNLSNPSYICVCEYTVYIYIYVSFSLVSVIISMLLQQSKQRLDHGKQI